MHGYRLGSFSAVKSAIALLSAGLLLAACSAPSASTPSASPSPKNVRPIASPAPTLDAAIAQATNLGPAGTGTRVYLSLGLKVRQQDKLASVIATGATLTPAQYAAQFGPDRVLVDRAVVALRSAGLAASWRNGSSLITADGPAPAVSALLGVSIQDYRLPSGATFYASTGEARLPGLVAAVVNSVSGLDNYRQSHPFAVRPGGLTGTDVLAFYNLKPLRDAGLDGSGQTIVLPEIDDLPNLNDLNKFATKYGLPPYDQLLTVKRDPSWGTPLKPQGETVLDLEIIHMIAPNAKMVIYLSAADFAHGERAFDQMVTDRLGSIISESLGACETETSSGHRSIYAQIQDRAVALGMGHYVASGDSGAFTCGQSHAAAGSFPSTLPTVTAIGGTSIFQAKDGGYYKEYAWGSPIDETGTGGGASGFFPLPDYQKSVSSPDGHGFRQVPDVSAAADPNTGFHIIFGGKDGQAGGTSAAAPLWAATAALINQDLQRSGMRETGFANPALYWMGENAAKFPERPFHDVVGGNNLAYTAGPGWDMATGWGSMDAAALDRAWILYLKGGGA